MPRGRGILRSCKAFHALEGCSACQALCQEGRRKQKSGVSVQSRVEGHLLLDPTSEEAAREDAGVLLAMLPSANQARAPCTSYWVLRLTPGQGL